MVEQRAKGMAFIMPHESRSSISYDMLNKKPSIMCDDDDDDDDIVVETYLDVNGVFW